MKKSSIVLVLLVLSSVFGSMFSASADCDPMGSCEDTSNNLTCAGTAVGPIAYVATANNASGAGAEVCNGNGPIPPYGRAAVYRQSNGNVIVGVDGETQNPGSSGWTRVDVRTSGSGCKAQVRRGSTGSYYTAGGGTSNPDVLDTSTFLCP